MQINLYQTLKSINVSDDQAKLVVKSLEEYIGYMIAESTKPLQDKLDSTKVELGAKIDAVQGQMRFQTAMIGLIGFAMTAIGVAATLLKH